MKRELKPELLDSLPPNHPDALHNRRDLHLTNRIMGNHRWFDRTLPPLLRPAETVLEFGAGTGELGARLAAQGVVLDGLDLWPRPAAWPAARAWHQVDLLNFDGYAAYSAVIGNLIFHQFSSSDLALLGRKLQRSTRLIIACEPWRRKLSQVCFARIAPWLGANYVSLHDAKVSIAAGFDAAELPQMLGLDASEWDWECSSTALGAYRMIATRRP